MKKLVSIMLVALMMLFTVASAFASEDAEETKETEVESSEDVAEETNETETNESAEKETESESAPGFESIFAIAGLLAASSLALGRRE